MYDPLDDSYPTSSPSHIPQQQIEFDNVDLSVTVAPMPSTFISGNLDSVGFNYMDVADMPTTFDDWYMNPMRMSPSLVNPPSIQSPHVSHKKKQKAEKAVLLRPFASCAETELSVKILRMKLGAEPTRKPSSEMKDLIEAIAH